MKHKILLTSLLGLTIACPSFAAVDIAKNPQTAPGCTNSVLKTYDGPAALEADYTANTINLNFYSDENTVYSTGTCTYDGGIELPSEDPTRTGYTFDGWQVRRASAHSGQQNEPSNPQQTTFDLSTLDASIDGTGSYGYIGLNGNSRSQDSKYSLTQNGEWATEFSYGFVKGMSQCRFLANSYYGCFCQVTGFDAEKDGTYLPVASSSWFTYGGMDVGDGGPDDCADYCPGECAIFMGDTIDFRAVMFGIPTPECPEGYYYNWYDGECEEE